METVSAENKGYIADILVVTYNHVKEIADNVKFRILLVSIEIVPLFWVSNQHEKYHILSQYHDN